MWKPLNDDTRKTLFSCVCVWAWLSSATSTAQTRRRRKAFFIMKKPQVFFNKPQRPIGVDEILHDILQAKTRVALVCAWFTDVDIASAIVESRAKSKVAILSRADINRAETSAAKMLSAASGTLPAFGFYVIGSNDWKEGIMHNKFIVADNVVWTGSYNFTFQARKNYETLIRFDDESISNTFYDEVMELSDEYCLWDGRHQFAFNDGAFRCVVCEKLKPISDMYELDRKHQDSTPKCSTCGKQERIQHGTR